ncbi:Hypothetical predicted protein [Olea europaea subsp. europaea]|uniref:Uncharacterized protein n=1 Tax=Olea europaea subsp. europaea TaxID=158383 RepID=A0A8S0SQY1_OLEEU|nr:Hypothetical predicted protein [Olea europaea subsp. europaea]
MEESNQDSKPESESSVNKPEEKKQVAAEVQGVTNKDRGHFKNANEDALPLILESILKRRISDQDFEEGHETNEEIDDLYNARDIVVKKMVSDPYFNMDDKKWDDMIAEAVEHGRLKDTRECEAILEDMLN